jgi:anti-sigma factor RsiW
MATRQEATRPTWRWEGIAARALRAELMAGGCTPDAITLFLLVERTARRRERARRAERMVRTLGAALVRIVSLPATLLLPTR